MQHVGVGSWLDSDLAIRSFVAEKAQTLDGGSELRLQTDYRANGQVDRHVLPSGAVLRYSYGGDGRTITITVNGVQVVRELEHFPLG